MSQEVIAKITEAVRENTRLEDANGNLLFYQPDAGRVLVHKLFVPASIAEIENYRMIFRRRLPESYLEFLSHWNGLSVFSAGIVIWGKRRNNSRTGAGIWQPLDLEFHNAHNELPDNSPTGLTYFGSTSNGNFWVYFESLEEFGTVAVGKTPRHAFECLQRWPCFEDWLTFELGRCREDRS